MDDQPQTEIAVITYQRMMEVPPDTPKHAENDHYCCFCNHSCIANSSCSYRYMEAQGSFCDEHEDDRDFIYYCDKCSKERGEFTQVMFTDRGLFYVDKHNTTNT
jgi:hypothetical protein